MSFSAVQYKAACVEIHYTINRLESTNILKFIKLFFPEGFHDKKYVNVETTETQLVQSALRLFVEM